MQILVAVLLALSAVSRARRCEWAARLCKPDHLSTSKCSLGSAVSWSSGAIEVQDLSTPVQILLETSTDKLKYKGFPYYIRIDLLCHSKESSKKGMLEALLTGLTPVVIVMFQEPTHPTRLKPQRLELELTTAPLLDNASCKSKKCQFGWYAPMPMINGTVVYRLKIISNKVDPHDILVKSFFLNVNGFVRTTQKGETETTLGTEIQVLEDMLRVGSPSRPLWAVVDHAPVLLLPGIPDFKAVLVTATEFQFTSLIEVNIRSHLSDSLSCSQEFVSMIQEAISTESSLFIRHNQQLYRFLGNYSLLLLKVPPSEAWELVLHSVCVSGLVPVSLPYHGKEYFYVLGGGLQSGTLYRAEILDGDVTFIELVDSFGHTACEFTTSMCCYMNNKRSAINRSSCQVRYVAQDARQYETDIILVELLPQKDQEHSYILLTLDGDFHMGDTLPKFIPNERQENSSVELKLNGMTFSPSTGILYIWGNTLICSYILTWDVGQNYLFFSGFPTDQMIKYFTLSYDGTFAFVTAQEELWWGQERTDSVFRLRPSQGWNVFSHLHPIHLSSLQEALSHLVDYSTLTVFYDGDKELQEVMYLVNFHGKGSIVKRKLPVAEILYYTKFAPVPHEAQHLQSHSHVSLMSECLFDWEDFEDLPNLQRFNRLQRYLVSPPLVTPPSGLHTTQSLAVYQGLLYHLLQLHAQYIMDIGDPYESPISRMRQQELDLCSNLACNSTSVLGVTVDMEGHSRPIYSQPSTLPDRVYLDRNTSFSFSLYIRAQQLTQDTIDRGNLNHVRLSVEVSDYQYLNVTVSRYVMFNREGVLYKVTVSDRGMFEGQMFPGEGLLSFSVLLRITNSEMRCFYQTDREIILKGLWTVPVFIGCPPGKRLVFDVKTSLQEAIRLNKRNFYCTNPDPVIPCFYFKNLFYPLFKVQDLVLGESRRFFGSYILKIVGGGPYSTKNIRPYSPEEVLRYNSLNYSSEETLVWMLDGFLDDPHSFNMTKEGFVIMNGSKNNGIRWVCKKNSPCGDVIPQGPSSPCFHFIIEVSNWNVDGMNTYCHYTARFEIIVHALSISESRQFFSYLMTLVCILGLIILHYASRFLKTAISKCHGSTRVCRFQHCDVAPEIQLSDHSRENDSTHAQDTNRLHHHL